MGKITVRHFLNKELNSVQKGSKLAYPVYVQVIVLMKNLKFKSNNHLFYYLSEDEIKDKQVLAFLDEERKTVENIVSNLMERGKEDLITSKNVNMLSENLDDMIERKFSELIKKEKDGKFVPNLILEGSYTEINEIIFFYNDSTPLKNISTNVDYCLQAIEQIKEIIEEQLFYVYDLFGGPKQDRLLSCLNSYTGYDEKLTNELFESLQYLAIEV